MAVELLWPYLPWRSFLGTSHHCPRTSSIIFLTDGRIFINGTPAPGKRGEGVAGQGQKEKWLAQIRRLTSNTNTFVEILIKAVTLT
jgi:hypothetical protein